MLRLHQAVGAVWCRFILFHVPVSETFSRFEEIMPAALHWAGVATPSSIAAAKALELMPVICSMQTT